MSDVGARGSRFGLNGRKRPRSSKLVAAQGSWANVKPLAKRVSKPAFGPFLYRYRNLIERFFNKLKHFRAIATRYEKHASNYLALIKLAATRIWLRAYESVT